MRAGNLKHKLTIETLTPSIDGFGAMTEDYKEFIQVYSEVSHIGTSQKYFTGKYIDLDVKKFRIRYAPGITNSMRIKFENEYYDIKETVDPYMNKRELLIVGEKVS